MFANSVGVGVGHRRDLRRGAARLRKNSSSSVSRVRQRAHHRLEVRHERHQVLDRLVDRRCPRPGQRVAVALEHRALVLARSLVVAGAEELVELDRLDRLRERDRVARPGSVSARVARASARCTSGRAPSAGGRHARVGGQLGSTLLSSFMSIDRDGALLGLRSSLGRGGDAGSDLLDHADAEAADAHLVAHHQVGAAGELGPDVVGGHERQARVGLYGQQHATMQATSTVTAPTSTGAGDDGLMSRRRLMARAGSRGAARSRGSWRRAPGRAGAAPRAAAVRSGGRAAPGRRRAARSAASRGRAGPGAGGASRLARRRAGARARRAVCGRSRLARALASPRAGLGSGRAWSTPGW